MEIGDVFLKKGGFLELTGNTKGEIFLQFAEALFQGGCIEDKDAFVEALYIREMEGTTSVGDETAIPHGISKTVRRTAFAYGHHKDGVLYQQGDNEKTKHFFCLAIPEDRSGQLELLSELAKKIMQPEFRSRLEDVKNEEELLAIL